MGRVPDRGGLGKPGLAALVGPADFTFNGGDCVWLITRGALTIVAKAHGQIAITRDKGSARAARP
jgi:hypothetical protein